MAKVYTALIADAVGSRSLTPAARKKLQADLRFSLRELNARYRRELAARFDVTLGDELQCLLTGPDRVWEISHHVRYKFPEVDWVIACGRGAITTALGPGITAPHVDGPCFHEARAALEAGKREHRVLVFRGFNSPNMDAAAAYYSALYWSWTRRQRGLAAKWRAWGDFEAALPPQLREALHPSAVSHMRRRMAWLLVVEGDRMLGDLLSEAS